jgi:hypothetical protein
VVLVLVYLVDNYLRIIRFKVTSLHVLEMTHFTKKYKISLEQNVHVCGYNTWKEMDLHVLACNTAFFQKVTFTWEFDYIIKHLLIQNSCISINLSKQSYILRNHALYSIDEFSTY